MGGRDTPTQPAKPKRWPTYCAFMDFNFELLYQLQNTPACPSFTALTTFVEQVERSQIDDNNPPMYQPLLRGSQPRLDSMFREPRGSPGSQPL